MNCEHYIVNNTNIEAYGLSDKGQVRAANEDSCGFATVPNGELFVVCDGMGGHVGGATASRIAVEQIKQHFQDQLYPNVYQALHDALCRANIQILGAAAADPSLKGMGTTACIVLFTGNDAYIAHVGDSRIYLFEAEKKRLFRITKDHSFVQSLVDMGQLDDRDAEHHPRKNVIMKALGTKEDLKPEVYMSPVQPAKGDMFLICSDGLSGMVDDNGIEAILSSDQSTEQKVLDLVNNANVPGKGLDNITAQVIKVLESPYPVSNHPDHNPRWRNQPNGGTTRDVEMSVSPQMPLQAVEPPKKKRSATWLVLIIVGVMLLVGGGAALLLFGLDQPDLEARNKIIAQKETELTQTRETLKGLNKENSPTAYKMTEEKIERLEKDLAEEYNKRDQSESNKGRGLLRRLLFGNKGNKSGDNPSDTPSNNTGGKSDDNTSGNSGENTGGNVTEDTGVDPSENPDKTTDSDIDNTTNVPAEMPQYTFIATVTPVQAGTIKYNNNSVAKIEDKFPSGAKVTLIAIAAEGYTFTNWTENGKKVSTNAKATFDVRSNRNLVANFKQKPKAEKKYTIKVTAEPSDGGTVKGRVGEYDQNETCTLTAEAKPGYEISHWSDNGSEEVDNGKRNHAFKVSEDHTVVAHFKKIIAKAQKPTYNIIVTAEPSEGGTVTGGNRFEYGEKTTLTATPKNGYVVKSWTKDGQPYDQTGKDAIEITVEKDATYKAHFELKDSASKTKTIKPSNDDTASDE
ncbi:MAG: Stp1/IreP family PP2C-type Ser/Thr phosphatase [Bacteroidales bacterium]|nr:Stp1/IreP family PP2C-type Ser/Thr phosphatase [Bacteroidales bacterium]